MASPANVNLRMPMLTSTLTRLGAICGDRQGLVRHLSAYRRLAG